MKRMRKAPVLRQAQRNAWKALYLAKLRLVCLQFACGRGNIFPSSGRQFLDSRKEYEALHGLLYQKINECYRVVMMWRILLNDQQKDDLVKEVMSYYLSTHMEIASYLDINLQSPDAYDCKITDAMRVELKQLID